jgi:TolA-binding protein
MAYDPNLPANHAPVVSQELRDQFAGLKALIDAQQAQIDGQQSQIGDMNSSIADLQDAVNALQGHP